MMHIAYEHARETDVGYSCPVKVIDIEPGRVSLDALIKQLVELRAKLGSETAATAIYDPGPDHDGTAGVEFKIFWSIAAEHSAIS